MSAAPSFRSSKADSDMHRWSRLPLVLFLAAVVAPVFAQPEADSLRKYYGDADPCQRNVSCEEGTPWFNEIGAVARVVPHPFDSTGRGCTGTFVNNTIEDLAPYFLSAVHCIGGDIGTVRGFAYQFYWQTLGCTNPIDPPEFEYLVAPARLEVEGLETNGEDFALQRLRPSPQVDSLLAGIGIHFAGWSIANDLPTRAVLIGHPQGDVKKIVSGEDQNPVMFSPESWGIDIKTGRLELGQSGSALLNEEHEVMGVTRWGVGCSGTGATANPRLANLWDIAYFDSTQSKFVTLSDFLDPLDTGASEIVSLANYDLDVSGEKFSDPMTDFAAGFFRTTGSIVADNDTLQSGGRLHLRARESIAITGDFLAEGGGDLFVSIDPTPAGGGANVRAGDEVVEAPLPALPLLEPNFPNPFRHHTTFRFSIPEDSHVSLVVYDLLGREVMTLMDGNHQAGNVTLHWVATNKQYRPLASGVYFYQLRAGDTVVSGRMTFLGHE